MIRYLMFTSLILIAPLLRAGEVKLSLNKKGVEIDAGKGAVFTLQAPLLAYPGDKTVKPESYKDGEARYPGGTIFRYEIKDDEVRCSYEKLPDDGHSFKFLMEVPMSFLKGGTYTLGKDTQEVPDNITTEQFLMTGQAEDFSFANKDGRGLKVEVVSNWYGLQDNRVWNTESFSYQFLIDTKAVSGKDFPIKFKAVSP